MQKANDYTSPYEFYGKIPTGKAILYGLQHVLAYGAIMGASVIGGLFETVLGFFLKPLRRFFSSVVTGTVVLAIGLSLISVGVNFFGGGNNAADFGSLENLLVGLIVLVAILAVKHYARGMASSSAILIGIVVGYIVCFIMGMVLPTTAINADGVEYTKAWVLNFDKVVNRMALACGAIFLILCGLFPKLAALISIMPQSVLGGAAVIMFSSIVISGIQLITREPLTARNITIISVALGLGYGVGANSALLNNLPELLRLTFGGSGIVPAAVVAIVLNIVLPKER